MTYRKATSAEVDAFLELLRADAASYLEPTLRMMGATWDEFARMVRTVGEVRTLRGDEAVLGQVWIELRGRELHVHGLAVRPEARGQGIGTQVFSDLEAEFRQSADTIELGAHESNLRALRLYERLGFRVEERLPDVGFAILRKPLHAM